MDLKPSQKKALLQIISRATNDITDPDDEDPASWVTILDHRITEWFSEQPLLLAKKVARDVFALEGPNNKLALEAMRNALVQAVLGDLVEVARFARVYRMQLEIEIDQKKVKLRDLEVERRRERKAVRRLEKQMKDSVVRELEEKNRVAEGAERGLKVETLERDLKEWSERESDRQNQAVRLVAESMEKDLKVERLEGNLKKERRKVRALEAKIERIRKDVEVVETAEIVEDVAMIDDGKGKELTVTGEETRDSFLFGGEDGYYNDPSTSWTF